MLYIILIILAILFLHWIADGVLQTDKMAKGKSKNWKDLLDHTITYSGIFTLASIVYIVITNNIQMIAFGPITFIFHTATDYVTSRVNARLWEQKKVHGFFVSVLFDQWLHFVQLLLTFYFLS